MPCNGTTAPVMEVVWDRMPATLQLTAADMVAAVVLGVALGADIGSPA